MTRNIPKRSFLVHSATRWTCGWSVIYVFSFFAHGARVGRQIYFFRSEAEKNTFFTSILMDQSGNRKEDYCFLGLRIALWVLIRIALTFFFFFFFFFFFYNEYPQRVLWRNKQNYPLIITKYPPYLFHFLCAQQRLRSAWAFAQPDQSHRCPLTEQLRSQGFFMQTAKSLIRRGRCPA